jgi:hypothetical protein
VSCLPCPSARALCLLGALSILPAPAVHASRVAPDRPTLSEHAAIGLSRHTAGPLVGAAFRWPSVVGTSVVGAAFTPVVGAAFTPVVGAAFRRPSGPVPRSGRGTPAVSPDGPSEAQTLDEFMERVLARREVNRKTLQEYVLEETEQFAVVGPGRTLLYRTRRDYTWYVRDDMHVRSPLRVNGVVVGDRERERYETDWIRREHERRERKAKEAAEGKEPRDVPLGSDGIQVSGGVVPTEPRFVSEAYFLEFKFEPGNYYLAGREQLEGQDVLRVEYYPTGMFGPKDESERRRERRSRRADEEAEREIQTKMNRTALITLWIDPAEHQIVKYTFENVWLDFLPGGWVVRVDEIGASMTMGQPFPGVWLPRDLHIQAGVTLANGSYAFAYDRAFSDYRLAEVETRIGVPRDSPRQKRTDPPPPPGSERSPQARQGDHQVEVFEPELRGRGPFVSGAAPQNAQEVVGEIRVHGNVYLTDDEVRAIAAVQVGDALAEGSIDAIAGRLQQSDRFDTVDVRKRYRSLTDMRDVALVLVVHERAGVRSSEGSEPPGRLPGTLPNPARRLLGTMMFLPIAGYADGYGFSYGGRFSTVGLLGAGERLSVPLTWGATRRAALEAERPFTSGPLTLVAGSWEIRSRENPRFDLRDRRVEVGGRAERVFLDRLRARADATRGTVRFGALDDRLWTIGTSLALDMRANPAFPVNAVYVAGGWTGMHFTSTHPLPGRVDRYTADVRGYVRAFRQMVVATRAQYTGADASLPPYERLLLGGAPTLRGFRAGSFDGDRLLVSSAELRVPITSVLSGARFGLTAFVDAGTVWDHGRPASSAAWHRGAGGGIFLIASVLRLNVDVARGLGTGRTRLHVSSGFLF